MGIRESQKIVCRRCWCQGEGEEEGQQEWASGGGRRGNAREVGVGEREKVVCRKCGYLGKGEVGVQKVWMSREGRRGGGGCTCGASVRERVKGKCAECMGVRYREQGLFRRYGCQENGKVNARGVSVRK